MSYREAPSSRKAGAGPRLTPAMITGGVLAILAIVFIFENTQKVRIRLLIPEVTMPLYLGLLATFVIGALCGGIFFRRRSR
ncbi:lipopolysaccharide assembly protein LapA domain-containing protein [Streptomyces sp. NPDC005279]|uniref:lipopolysaccharide assembly protein LapA domain-containing protein n=1 Tax=Streptomyces sp. NPDC005279 TaxID=3364712 RepID=UPI0036A9A34C